MVSSLCCFAFVYPALSKGQGQQPKASVDVRPSVRKRAREHCSSASGQHGQQYFTWLQLEQQLVNDIQIENDDGGIRPPWRPRRRPLSRSQTRRLSPSRCAPEPDELPGLLCRTRTTETETLTPCTPARNIHLPRSPSSPRMRRDPCTTSSGRAWIQRRESHGSRPG